MVVSRWTSVDVVILSCGHRLKEESTLNNLMTILPEPPVSIGLVTLNGGLRRKALSENTKSWCLGRQASLRILKPSITAEPGLTLNC